MTSRLISDCEHSEERGRATLSFVESWSPESERRPWRWPRSSWGRPPIPQSLTARPHRVNPVLFNSSLSPTDICLLRNSVRAAGPHCCSLVCQACERRRQKETLFLSPSLCRAATKGLVVDGPMLPDELDPGFMDHAQRTPLNCQLFDTFHDVKDKADQSSVDSDRPSSSSFPLYSSSTSAENAAQTIRLHVH